jgi:hypothetical protein
MFAAPNFFQTGGGSGYRISDMFSTTTYTGNASSQTITNGIDLASKGGLVWTKSTTSPLSHALFDTERGLSSLLKTDSTSPFESYADFTSWNSNGYSVGNASGRVNGGSNYVSWTFRKQPKFFDIVTWTGDDNSTKTINHSLGSAPGFVIVKAYGNASNWSVFHRSLSSTSVMFLNRTDEVNTFTGTLTLGSTSITLPGNPSASPSGYTVNTNTGGTGYVAYLFAHDAGSFGSGGTGNAISCGSFTTNGSGGATVTLGYQPQWLLVKNTTTGSTNWFIWDTARGWTADGTSGDYYLIPNLADAQGGGGDYGGPSSTGFVIRNLQSSNDFIYIAIRASS